MEVAQTPVMDVRRVLLARLAADFDNKVLERIMPEDFLERLPVAAFTSRI